MAKVLSERRNDVCWIILNRPEKLNALDKESWSLLARHLKDCNDDQSISAIVLTGNGRAFSAGDDINAMLELKDQRDALDFFNTLYSAIENLVDLKKPLLCAVNGLAYGGGCEILLFCDVTIAVKDATFSIPEGKLGLIPPMAISVGYSILGRSIARLALTGDSITAEEAKIIGLVDIVVQKEDLHAEVEKQLEKIKSIDKNSIRTMKYWLKNDKEKIRNAVVELALMSLSDSAKKRMEEFVNRKRTR
ncbi:enoyl-CoA hydratase/isomerase family protein [Sulfolobus sp. E5-1-F]|uniref:enoyl-CoA hydratase/isomerase family protein n=1 Tax=Sulfolobaceae TaxID=118883 RepID=UPI001296C09F|nr:MULTISPECIES: enoyl-CoA hydratase/isomerase family protein [unclassified Sulfolobus]QGA53677.1 enoyl-CoA hydratase/isomerase family protein [Sulfolobus sp. E5-1-F]QGA68669.1 enoyl-CoA hydratase/isomerase family protein [Sulfolobus sp. E11-6]